MDTPGAGGGHTKSSCHLRTDGHPNKQLWLSRAAGARPGAAKAEIPRATAGAGTESGNTAEPHGPAALRVQLSHVPRTDGQLSMALSWTIPAAPLCVKLLQLLPPPKHGHISSPQGGTDLQEGPAELSRPPGCAGEHHPNLPALGLSSRHFKLQI